MPRRPAALSIAPPAGLAARQPLAARPRLATFALLALLAPLVTGCPDPPAPAAPPAPPPGTYAPYAGYPAYPYPPAAAPTYAPGTTPAYPPSPAYPPAYPPAPSPAYPPAPAPAYPPAPTYAPPASAPTPGRPLLGPLVGPAMWQAEARAVLQELEAHLSPANQQLVAGIPLVFDPDPTQINAFAGCDDSGAPFIAGTEGLLEAIDAIAQTKSTDEIYGTRTYDAYASAVTPALVSQQGGRALLPPGIVPAQAWADPRRISRAHEMFDEIVAFTFGHELSHHYLGHTGCANGQPAGVPPGLMDLGRLLSSAVHTFNQPNEIAADSSGCINVLDTGLARSRTAYRWTEEGGLWLLDFFARMDGAAGAGPVTAFLSTHPSSGLRIPIVQGVAATWHLQHGA